MSTDTLAGSSHTAHGTHNRSMWTLLLVAVFVLLHALMKLYFSGEALRLGLSGDETAYTDAAMALSNLLRDMLSSAPIDTGELSRNVVGNGWFMPGMSLLITPLYLFAPDPDIVTLRTYLGIISFSLWILALVRLDRNLGRPYAVALSVFPVVCPVWIFFSFSAWGDLYGGLVLVILLSELIGLLQRYRTGAEIRWTHGIPIGVLMACLLYLRSSALPLMGIIIFAIGITAFLYRQRNARLGAMAPAPVAVLTFCLLVAPWSITASNVLGGRVLSTSTVPLSIAATFGNQREICFGPCERGNIWFSAVRYSKSTAATLGTSELEVQKEMSRYATRHTTLPDYLRKVRENFERYAFKPDGFSGHFLRSYPQSGQSIDKEQYQARMTVLTRYPYFLAMAIFGIAFLLIERKRQDLQLTGLVIKGAAVAAMVQPFVHISGGRYWPSFAPLFALGTAYLVVWAGRRMGASAPTPDAAGVSGVDPATSLWRLQIVIVAGVSACVLAFFLATGH